MAWQPSKSRPWGGTLGFLQERRLSYEGPSEASPGGSGGHPPGKKAKVHTKTRAKRHLRGLGPKERSISILVNHGKRAGFRVPHEA
jgi:hypothetical protein